MKKINLAHLTLLCIFISSGFINCIKAQNQDFIFKKFTVKDGLSHQNVYSIMQDKLGYLWFGTQDGLNKYDGYKFTIYRNEPGNPNSISTGNFGKIFQDSEGLYWFGTFGEGIDLFDPHTNTITNFSNIPEDSTSLSNNQITFIFEDSNHEIWIGTASGGLNKFNKKTRNFKRYEHNPNDIGSLSHVRAKCICETKDGSIWVGTGNGLDKLNKLDGSFTHYRFNPNNKNSISGNSIQHLLVDKDDNIWIAIRDGGLNKMNYKTNEFTHYINNPNDPKSLSDNKAEFLFIDSYNQFWIGTYEGGLNLFDREEENFQHFKYKPDSEKSISSNRIEYIYEDNSKVLWIGTRGGGISKLDLKPKKFKNIISKQSDPNSLLDANVMAITSDKQGNLWIGTDGGGLTKYNPVKNEFVHFKYNPKNPNSLSNNRVWSIYIDREGIIWAGTYLGGLNRIEQVNETYNFTIFKNNPADDRSLSSNQINTIAEDKQGNLWVATSNGLNKLIKTNLPDNYTFESYYFNQPEAQSFVDNYISNLMIDSKGRIWNASYQGGLLEFVPGKNEFIKCFDLIQNRETELNDVHALILFEDKNGNLWVGTESNGILNYDPDTKSIQKHPLNEAFNDAFIMGMLEDDIGNTWISTSQGLIKYNQINNTIRKYNYNDGLAGIGFNRNSLFKDKQGNLYFGSNAALTYFSPVEVSNNPYIPKIVITDIEVLNKSLFTNYLLPGNEIIHRNNEIIINPKDYFFSIDFASLDFTSPDQNQYKYMLENFDTDWIDAGNKRSATYTNLDPGNYVFKVTGSNNDKIWNEVPVKIKIKVKPPFYKNTWFILLEIVFLTLLIFIYIRIRTYSLIKDKNRLEEKVKERTEEIILQQEELRAQAESLEKINTELENQQNILEELVKERTADLEIAKNKAEESDRLKSAFLANMSHEIRTPMNAIIGFTNILNETEVDQTTKQELSALIVQNSFALLNVIDDIIDISKIESGQLKLRPADFKLNEMLLEIYDDTVEKNLNTNIQVKLNIHSDYNQLIFHADVFRLKQIFKNLISNALKFTEIGFIEFGYLNNNNRTDNSFKFFVKDTGIGLSKEQQGIIFSRFTKVETDMKKIYRGAGLGLAICKSLTELMNGKIWVESDTGKGATFFFEIPLNAKESDEESKIEKKEIIKYNWINKTILIAEDETSNYKFLEMIIKRNKANILWAKSGNEVLDIFNQNKDIDLILMDIKMPEMDGIETIRQIRKENNKIPIVAQTAYYMPEDQTRCFEAGASDFIAKPINKEKIISLINKFIINT